MARVFRCGPGSPYGCAHHDEHVRAARLGWLRRRLGLSATVFTSKDESRWLSRVVGEVKGAHTHSEHPNVIAFKQGRRWYELPRAEFKRLIRAGRDAEREEQAEAKRQASAEVKEQRYQEMRGRHERAYARAERAEVVKIIKAGGGIRLASREDRGEYEMLPTDVRRSKGRYTMDTAASAVNAEMPWLNIDTPDDLVRFFDRAEEVNRRARRQIADEKAARQERRARQRERAG